MALQILFGDDEHTAKDGPYSRLLRARKWLYVSAAAATFLSLNLYHAEKANEIFQVISLPKSLLSPVVAAGLAYLFIQYSLLLVQLGVTYDITLAERLSFRRADDLAAAAERFSRAREELGATERRRREELMRHIHAADENLAAALETEEESRRQLSSIQRSSEFEEEIRKARNWSDGAKVERIRLEQRRKESAAIFDGHMADLDDERLALRQAVSEAAYALDSLKRQNPADRAGYSVAERLIDLGRVAPPLVVGGLALYHLLLSLG